NTSLLPSLPVNDADFSGSVIIDADLRTPKETAFDSGLCADPALQASRLLFWSYRHYERSGTEVEDPFAHNAQLGWSGQWPNRSSIARITTGQSMGRR
ncbi:hypothetical protein T265_13590, partial [Opisthorchis viverrini]